MRKLALTALLIVGFCGCEDRAPQTDKNDTIEIPPPDVPIAKSDGNATIDSDFPPMPVVE